MRRHPSSFTPGTRALAAFTGTVVLTILAALVTPDEAVQSVDAMTLLPGGLDQILPDSFFE